MLVSKRTNNIIARCGYDRKCCLSPCISQATCLPSSRTVCQLLTVLVTPSNCCSARHGISFPPPMATKQPLPEPSRLQGMGSYAAASVLDQSSYRWWTEETFDCSLVWFPTEHCQPCNWPVKEASPGMSLFKWWAFWTSSVKLQNLPNKSEFFMCFKWFLMSYFYCVDTVLNSKAY
jgi:hypothetical protein